MSTYNEGLVSAAQDGQLTAENLLLEVGDVSFAYRRFGVPPAMPALVMLQHFRGNLDNWDPALRRPIYSMPLARLAILRNALSATSQPMRNHDA